MLDTLEDTGPRIIFLSSNSHSRTSTASVTDGALFTLQDGLVRHVVKSIHSMRVSASEKPGATATRAMSHSKVLLALCSKNKPPVAMCAQELKAGNASFGLRIGHRMGRIYGSEF